MASYQQEQLKARDAASAAELGRLMMKLATDSSDATDTPQPQQTEGGDGAPGSSSHNDPDLLHEQAALDASFAEVEKGISEAGEAIDSNTILHRMAEAADKDPSYENDPELCAEEAVLQEALADGAPELKLKLPEDPVYGIEFLYAVAKQYCKGVERTCVGLEYASDPAQRESRLSYKCTSMLAKLQRAADDEEDSDIWWICWDNVSEQYGRLFQLDGRGRIPFIQPGPKTVRGWPPGV